MTGWGLILLTHGTTHILLYLAMVALELAYHRGRSAVARHHGTRTTSPSGTACCTSSCWARSSFPRRRRSRQASCRTACGGSPPPAWSSSTPFSGCTSTNPSTTTWSTTGTPSSGATVTSSSSPPPPGPALRSWWTAKSPGSCQSRGCSTDRGVFVCALAFAPSPQLAGAGRRHSGDRRGIRGTGSAGDRRDSGCPHRRANRPQLAF